MVDRITLLLKTRNISASQFADEIGVQRSSISHVLSGRNKPSLDFIQKILVRYPEINPDWLLFGKGSMNLEYNLFSELTDPVPVKPEALSKVIQRQERPIRAVPEENLQIPQIQHPQENEVTDAEVEQISTDFVPVPEIQPSPIMEVKPIENTVIQIVANENVPETVSVNQEVVPPITINQVPPVPPVQPQQKPQAEIPVQPIQPPQPSQKEYTSDETMAALAPLVEKEVAQITIFYKDRTFILYKPG